MHNENHLAPLYKQLNREYTLYCKGLITEREYCLRVRPIDAAITQVEMTTLLGTSVLPVSFEQKVLKLGC